MRKGSETRIRRRNREGRAKDDKQTKWAKQGNDKTIKK